MKILFLFYISSGGVDTLNRQRCRALISSGIECHLLYLQEGSGQQNISKIPTFVTSNEDEIKEIIRREQYDIILTCTNASIMPILRQPYFTGKLIYEIQGVGGDIITFFRREAANIETYADGILYPVTPQIHSIVHKMFPAKKKYSFHNCFYTDDFHSIKTEGHMSPPIIGWIGRLEENKNWKSFLTIAFLLKKKVPKLKIWMFHDAQLADKQEMHRFQRMVSRLHLSDDLTVQSNVKHNEMPYFYSFIAQSGGLLCSTSKQEGFGYAAVEAMVCQCPVLTTDSDGVKAFIIHNETGKYFSHDDEEEGATAAYELMTDKAIRNKIIQQGLQHIISIISPQNYVQNFLSMASDL